MVSIVFKLTKADKAAIYPIPRINVEPGNVFGVNKSALFLVFLSQVISNNEEAFA